MAKKKIEYENAAILFLDIKRYSQLNLDQAKVFHNNVMEKLYKIVAGEKGERRTEYLYMNTWGDGIILISKNCRELTLVGLNLRDYFKNPLNYQRIKSDGGEEITKLGNVDIEARVAIHFGRIVKGFDKFQDRASYFGPTIILPARIEPITPPGRVWVTDRIRDLVEEQQTQEPPEVIEFDQREAQALAKQYGEKDIYEARFSYEPKKPWPEEARIEKTEEKGGGKKKEDAGEQDADKGKQIDEDTARRIKFLTNEDPRKKDIGVCSRIPTEKGCPVKAPSMRLISDIRRNGETVGENLVVANSLRAIEAKAQNIVDNYEKRQCKDKDIFLLGEEICTFLNLFGDFGRKYKKSKYSNPCLPNKRPKDFLVHKTYGTGKYKCVEPFINAIEEFQEKCSDKYEGKVASNEFVDKSLIKIAVRIMYRSNLLGNRMEELCEHRSNATNKAVKDGFKKFKRDNLVNHLKKTISNLIKNTQMLPVNWPQ